MQVSAGLVKDRQGQPICLMVSLTDVTESRRIHEILDRKQKNLEAIFDAAPLGMLLVNQQMRVVRANDTIRQMSGKEYPDMIDHDACQALACLRASPTAATESAMRTAMPPAESVLPAPGRRSQTVLASGEPVRGVEVRPMLNEEGDQVQPWLSLSVEPVNIDGAKHVVVALNDVTDRKRAEEAAEGNHGDEIAIHLHGLARAAHADDRDEGGGDHRPGRNRRQAEQGPEALSGYRQAEHRPAVAADRRRARFPEAQCRQDEIRHAGERHRRVVEEAYATMQPHAAKSQVDLAIELEPNLPAVVYDGDRIMQVLTNLISNAIKFTPEGGRVLVSVHRREEHLVIKVSDTGYGIPKEDLPKLFNQFFRVHRPGKEIKGTGLGLAIVSKIVAGHGGRIEVESELDKGTTFTVLLPLTSRRRPRRPPMRPTGAWKAYSAANELRVI